MQERRIGGSGFFFSFELLTKMKNFAATILLLTFSAWLVSCEKEVAYYGPNFVLEGSTFVITCELHSALQLKWTKDRVKLEGPEYNMNMKVQNYAIRVSELTVHNANTNHSGNYSCHNMNTLTHRITVVFDLTTDANTVQTFDLTLKEDNVLQCNFTYDEKVTITWMKDGALVNINNTQKYNTIKNESSGRSDLVIKHAEESDAGVYTCLIAKRMDVNQTIIARTRAQIGKLPNSINLVEGEKLNLTCVVYGYPTPNVTWYKDNIAVKELNQTRIKLLPSYANVTDATLLIEQLEYDDRAKYRCDVVNDVNSANVTVMIRVKDKLAALWPFLGIVAEVAILCTIIFIYEKRRAKQEYDESDTDQNTESKSVGDQKDKDVRQRK